MAYKRKSSMPVPEGGTGTQSFTANQPVIAGSSSTAALTQVAAGTAGQVFKSNGSSAPSWQSLGTLNADSAFAAYLSADSTGYGSTTPTWVTVPFDSTLYNYGSHYNTTSHVFTAPVGGLYVFVFSPSWYIVYNDSGSTTLLYKAQLVTTSRTYVVNTEHDELWRDPANTNSPIYYYWDRQSVIVADMSANDTAYIQVQPSMVSTTITYTLLAGTSSAPLTMFWGYRLSSASDTGVTSVNSQTGTVSISGGTTGATFTGSTGTVTMSLAGITANGGTVSLGTDSTDNAINIGTAASSGRTVTIGNSTGTSSTVIDYGTGGFTLASASGNVMVADSSGRINYPLQPCFSVTLTSNISSVTGDATLYQIDFGTYGSEIFDVGGHYSSNQFVAPVTGKYEFSASVVFGSLTSSHTDAIIELVTSNRTYIGQQMSPQYTFITTGTLGISGSWTVDMDASDTSYLAVQVGGSTKAIAVIGSASNGVTTFSGFLVC